MRRTVSGYLALAALSLALVSCADGGSGAVPGGEGEVTAPADLSGLDAGQLERYQAARKVQQEALDGTRKMVERADSASVEELEEAMGILNSALLQGRVAINRVRDEKPPGMKSLTQELRRSNKQIRTAFNALLVHHPDPSTDMINMGGD